MDLDPPRAVRLGASRSLPQLEELAGQVPRTGSLLEAVAFARSVAAGTPLPGGGDTLTLWETLATVAAADLTVARVLEPHLDALAILDQAGLPHLGGDAALWGVYAAEGPPPRLTARPARPGTDDGWVLSGRKHWCSLADTADRALVTAWVDDERRGLFAVDLRQARPAEGERWVARGLAAVVSTPVDFDATPAVAVGAPGWYLTRPGFVWGGLGVAAVWYGGAVGVARRLARHRRGSVDQIGQMHLGAVDAVLFGARCVLTEAARAVDAGEAHGAAGSRLALRVRQVVRRAAEEVLHRSDHAMGPAPLAGEEEHARRVADLHLYLRQEHAERDQAALGCLVEEESR